MYYYSFFILHTFHFFKFKLMLKHFSSIISRKQMLQCYMSRFRSGRKKNFPSSYFLNTYVDMVDQLMRFTRLSLR